jgi:hypothetical protein
LLTAIEAGCGCIGAAISILAGRRALNRYRGNARAEWGAFDSRRSVPPIGVFFQRDWA